jgi:hypothetical protein
MTLFIACLLIYGFNMPPHMYAVAIVIWMLHLVATN